MSESPERRPEGEREATGEIPLGQRLMDRPFLLLAAGFVVMALTYTAWGILEILSLPEAPLP